MGPLTDAYSLTSDWDNQWLTGGLEADVIAEAHLDPKSIFEGIQRFAKERAKRLARQREMLDALSASRQGEAGVQLRVACRQEGREPSGRPELGGGACRIRGGVWPRPARGRPAYRAVCQPQAVYPGVARRWSANADAHQSNAAEPAGVRP